MTEPSGPDRQGSAGGSQRDGTQGTSGSSWESRAAGLAGDVQRWLIRTSARTMRDELGDQVRRAFRGQDKSRGQDSRKADVWATATTEPPRAEGEPPECAWCPVCRAARRLARTRIAAETDSPDGTPAPDLSEVVTGAIRDVLGGIDSVLSYRPGEARTPEPGSADPASAQPAQAEAAWPDGTGAEASTEAGTDESAEAGTEASSARPGDDRAEEPEDEPGHRS